MSGAELMESIPKEEDPAGRPHRSGVVTVIGPPNAGKSTLLNRLLGQKIAIVSPKPQTTRTRILGVVSGVDYQIILLDTPGLHRAREMINREMVRVAMDSLADADLVLFLADATASGPERMERLGGEFASYLEKIQAPVLLALNKIDLLRRDALLPLLDWYARLHPFREIFPISALDGDGVDRLLHCLIELLPEGPRYFPDDIPTDASERFIVAEIIREKVFLLTREEIPYATAVRIDAFLEDREDRPVEIHATILVEQPGQKGIIIGRQGSMLKEIGRNARLDIEELLDRRVVLRLWVKVMKNWTTNTAVLRELGLLAGQK